MINCTPHFLSGACRCQGDKKDLDGNLSKYPRSREYTEELVRNLPVKTLWTNYGIIPDVVVCSSLLSFFVVVSAALTNCLGLRQPFTNDFERADIHELIAPDLLHQIIKGTFKDHLVEWIQDYIHATYKPESEALKVLDDIDQR